jgi:hypothetical protein
VTISERIEASGDPQAWGFASGYVDRALRRVPIEAEELPAGAVNQP